MSSAVTDSVIRKSASVLGGAARLRDTRIAVWMLVRARQLGLDDAEIAGGYMPPLAQDDLDAAWKYYREHSAEIDEAIRLDESD